ncbi:LamB/YcsF family protein [Candidatus Puniceispirillum marinum]|uniref:LamB/YcsF family protein n=1 Tax=Puniceispirillum marinum (strain IMCC1322) TaxID=488538 RepID=D5BMH2_PUNMI|nr:LamB/YcsF family protein [Candidatus Puniceispirillum marinum]ADE40015.1 hypothetical protein SAR116_1772 [Candidatus Puniceispirillum marinum IMCC1322]
MTIDINCDMGESFGIYKMGNDEALMPFITEANVACGFHASDPNHMRTTVTLAKQHNVKIGAHFSLPDLAGFGRREMVIERDELANIIIYQIGALKEFLKILNVSLCHLKPHGSLYGMAARYEHVAHAVCDATEHLQLPVFGLAGTLHEQVYEARGIMFKAEFFADLDYDDDGKLLITREHPRLDPVKVADKALRAVTDGIVVSASGKKNKVRADTICIHSDTPNALEIVKAVNASLSGYMQASN